MQRTLPRPRPGTTLILYGSCPCLGPAIVFESPWDFAGARKVLYRDPTLASDVLDDTRGGRFGITEEGLWTRLYGELRFIASAQIFSYSITSPGKYAHSLTARVPWQFGTHRLSTGDRGRGSSISSA